MYKIQFGEHTLFILNNVCSFSFDLIGKNRAVIYNYTKKTKLQKIISDIQLNPIKNHIVFHSNPLEVFDCICESFVCIEAAGGIVCNELGEVLFIFRNNKWDLPKGKKEAEEGREMTAVREVEEECGIKVSKIEQHLITTYHTYKMNDKSILKSNYWYLMYADSQQDLIPQKEEDIDKVEWKKITDIPQLLSISYDSIKDVINSYLKLNSI